ncbi:MAG: hypothetical protein FJ098_14220, partial [Deltaproteobacteria bacterium]|nr:hypothetical protein [Deltaproteobacteria bacterium]
MRDDRNDPVMDPAPPEEGAAPADPKKEADEARAKALFTQFTLAFLKASSLTGYYPPDHPSIKNIAYEPYRIIGSLREFTPEIGFVTSSGTLGDEIMIDLLAEPLPFLSLMRSAMAETFAQKFINYLERNYLVSFAIRTSIQFDEFKRFISLFVERKTKLEAGAGEGLEVPFGQLLVEHEVYNISALSRDDVLGGQRVLPWRVKIAIARLRKDLQVLPMYSKASEMEIQAAKQLIIGDIIRPLRRPRFLRELLVNADLIRGQVGELYSVDVEQAIIDCLAPGMVDLVAQDVVRVLEGASWGLVMQQDGESERRIDEILKDLLKRLALRLATLDVNQTYDLLLHLFKLRVLGFLELPPNLRRMMQAEKWTGQFLLEEEIIVARFGAMTDPATYRAYLQNIDLVLPELLRRGSIGPAARLIKVLAEHARDHGNPIRQGMAQIALLDLSSQENVDRLRPQVLQDDRQVRQVAIAILRQFSFKGAEVLLEILGESDDAAVRRDVLAALEGMGVSIRTLLEERLQVAGLPWFVYRNLLLLVGRVGCEGALEDVKRFTSHMDHRVREQAL